MQGAAPIQSSSRARIVRPGRAIFLSLLGLTPAPSWKHTWRSTPGGSVLLTQNSARIGADQSRGETVTRQRANNSRASRSGAAT
jgi:hypothetical protein